MKDPLLILLAILFYFLVVAPAFMRWASTGKPDYAACVEAGIYITIVPGVIGIILFFLVTRLMS